MTRKEIIDGLEIYTAGRLNKDRAHITVKELQKFIDEIKDMEQEPCEDAISRLEALYLIADYDLSMGQVVKGIHDLPSVTPQPKMGRWIQVENYKCKCSECDVIHFIAMYPYGRKNYYPNCGAKMDELENTIEILETP